MRLFLKGDYGNSEQFGKKVDLFPGIRFDDIHTSFFFFRILIDRLPKRYGRGFNEIREDPAPVMLPRKLPEATSKFFHIVGHDMIPLVNPGV